MRKRYWAAIAAVALGAVGGTALAADIGNLSGQSCGNLVGTWHFVNNQTGNAGPGTLIATFSSGVCVVGPSQVNRNTQHFFCTGYPGTLLAASTDLPGRLVLSDFSCKPKEEEPPK